jgi:hypothetical protein
LFGLGSGLRKSRRPRYMQTRHITRLDQSNFGSFSFQATCGKSNAR